MSQQRRALGAAGEEQAAAWYAERGYTPVARNWRCREGELDLIVRRRRLYVVCEVKARATLAFGSPLEAVTAAKRLRIRRLTARWLEESGARPAELRFDVAAVLAGEIEVVEGAF